MTWTVRKIIALVLAIAAPIVAIIGLAVDAENLAFLWCIPVAIASYLFLGGISALGYAFKNAFFIIVNHLVIPGSLFGLVLAIGILAFGAIIGLIYFTLLPIVMFFRYSKIEV